MNGFMDLKGNGTARLALVIGLVATLVCVSFMSAFASDGVPAAKGETVPKDEVVYVKTSADGEVEGVYVVNVFKAGATMEVDDPADYESVVNLTTEDELVERDGVVRVRTLIDEPFYYQGNMSAQTELPWRLRVEYLLDGKRVEPQAVAGATGRLTIVLSIDPLEGGPAADFAQSYLLQAQGTFSSENFEPTDTGDATVARAGDSILVSAIVLPGEGGEFRIEGDAKDFEYDGWQISGVPLSMSVDLDERGLGSVDGMTDELQSATGQLASGAQSLDVGLADAASGARGLKEGAQSLDDGIGQLASGADGLAAGIERLAEGSDEYEMTLAAAAQNSSEQAAGLPSAQGAYGQAIAGLQMAIASGDQMQIASSLEALNASVEVLAQASGAAGASEALARASSGYADLAAGIEELRGNVGELATGVAGLADGAGSLSSGVSSLAGGIASASSGATELAGGTRELADAASGMENAVKERIQEAIDDKLGAGFVPHSFVAPGNGNVGSVQFIYVVEGVSVG